MARIDHSSHRHPNTPAARAACRKEIREADAGVAAYYEAHPLADNLITCTTNGAHCEMCGTTNPEDDGEGYTTCCNEPIVYGPCGRNHN